MTRDEEHRQITKAPAVNTVSAQTAQRSEKRRPGRPKKKVQTESFTTHVLPETRAWIRRQAFERGVSPRAIINELARGAAPNSAALSWTMP